MDKQQLIEKITQKKEFSQLPKKDVEMAFEKFDNDPYVDEEKVKLTRKLLREVFSAFTSQKLLSLKDKDFEWVLKKHVSTRERFPHYKEIYDKIFSKSSAPPTRDLVQNQGLQKISRNRSPTQNIIILDLGAGVNGFSYNYFSGKPKYVAVEAIGQLVDLMNDYFDKEEFNAKAIHESLFELEKLKKIIQEEKGEKVVLLFKTLDSLEMMQRDYSKELLKEIVPLVDKVVVSFAVKSIGKRERFRANRKWLVDFIKENFQIKEDFELGGEKYIVFSK